MSPPQGELQVIFLFSCDSSFHIILAAVHHFDDATTNYIYEYNIFWLDEASQDYYLLVSDFNQKDWYIYTFDAKTGFVIGKSFQLSCDGGVPNNECIPNHLTMY